MPPVFGSAGWIVPGGTSMQAGWGASAGSGLQAARVATAASNGRPARNRSEGLAEFWARIFRGMVISISAHDNHQFDRGLFTQRHLDLPKLYQRTEAPSR
ncbi:hypothetical protein, partial [Phaeovulum veldkampii]|uniref:hypothetical protein n=1 Tax=Phaeovulum veldkampii TaxID=33049 RepID=UPI001AEC8A8B